MEQYARWHVVFWSINLKANANTCSKNVDIEKMLLFKVLKCVKLVILKPRNILFRNNF